MRAAALAALLVLAGCGSAPEQAGAERAVERRSGGDARCTSRSRTWFREGPPAEVMLCVVDRAHGLCDRYRVDRDGAAYRVALVAREADCSLPAG